MPVISNQTEFYHGPANVKKHPLQYSLSPVILPDLCFPSSLFSYTQQVYLKPKLSFHKQQRRVILKTFYQSTMKLSLVNSPDMTQFYQSYRFIAVKLQVAKIKLFSRKSFLGSYYILRTTFISLLPEDIHTHILEFNCEVVLQKAPSQMLIWYASDTLLCS